MEGRERRRDHAAAPPLGLLDGLGERTVHDGRGLFEGRPQGVRRPAQAGAALPRQAPGELGSGPRHRDQRPRGRDARDQGQLLALALSARRRIGVHRGRDDAARDDARRHGGRGERRGRTLYRADRQAGEAADHRAADPDHRRRPCRSRARIGRGEDHAGPRLQRFRSRQAGRNGRGRDAQHARCQGARRAGVRRADPRRPARADDRGGAESRRRAAEGRGLPDRACRQGRRRARRRAAHDPDALWRSLRRGDRAVADRPMVCRRQDARAARDRGGARRRDRYRAQDLGEDVLQLDGEHPALVRVAPAVVGASDPGMVRARRYAVRG